MHPRRYMLILLAVLAVLLVVDAVVGWPYLRARLQAIAVLDRWGVSRCRRCCDTSWQTR